MEGEKEGGGSGASTCRGANKFQRNVLLLILW